MTVTAVGADESPDGLLCGVYEHYKSTESHRKYYLVLGIARHADTEEKVVVYVPLYPAGGPRMAVRPVQKFMGNVEIEDGVTRPRFQYVGTEVPDLSI